MPSSLLADAENQWTSSGEASSSTFSGGLAKLDKSPSGIAAAIHMNMMNKVWGAYPDWIRSFDGSISKFLSSPDGSYLAYDFVPNEHALRKAVKFLLEVIDYNQSTNEPCLSHLADGGVQIEWPTLDTSLIVSFYSDGDVDWCFDDERVGITNEGEGPPPKNIIDQQFA